MADYIIYLWNLYRMFWISNAIPDFRLNRMSRSRKVLWASGISQITKTHLSKYIENFTSKNWTFSDKKNSDIFHVSALNIDCEYSLEPPRRDSSYEYHNLCFWAEIRKNNV